MIYGIVAVEKNHGIGFNGSMPWPRLSEDMNFFQEKTKNNIILMGSTTYKSIGRNLSNRLNVIISSTNYPKADLTFDDPLYALGILKERFIEKDIYVIGGQKIFNSVKDIIDTYYITHIDKNYQCDTFFDLDFVLENYKNVTELESIAGDINYTIKEYKK